MNAEQKAKLERQRSVRRGHRSVATKLIKETAELLSATSETTPLSTEGSTNSRTGPDQIHRLFYGTDRTMNAEFKRMRQVCCHIGMESVTSARDGSAWVRLVEDHVTRTTPIANNHF